MFLKDSIINQFLQYVLFLLLILIVGLAIYYLIYIGNKHVQDDKKLNIKWKNITKLIIFGILITIISTLYKKYSILGDATFAIFISALIAFLLNPLVSKFEKLGIKRGLGTLLSYIIILAILVFLGITIIPDLITQSTKFFKNLPTSVEHAINSINQLLISWNIDTKILNDTQKTINQQILGLTKNLPEWISAFFETLKGSISTIITMVLVPIITYYFIVDKDKLIKVAYNIIPPKYRKDSTYLYKEINFAMKEFIISRALMAIFIGAATAIMLWTFNIPFAFVIGIITCIMDIVPYVGPVIASAPALIFAFIKSPMTFVWVAVLSWVLQWIEQNIVGPKLFSSSSGLHEVIILISIIIGGGIFGVWGMILSVPVVVIIKILFNFVVMKMKGIEPKFKGDINKAKAKEEMLKRKEVNREKRREVTEKFKTKFKR